MPSSFMVPDDSVTNNNSALAPAAARILTPQAAADVGGRSACASESAQAAEAAADESCAPRPEPGLVICAKGVRSQVDDPGDAEIRAGDAIGLRFPGVELVSPAASLFERPEPWATGAGLRGLQAESGQFHLSISPGVLQLSWTRPIPTEKTLDRAASHGRHVDVAQCEAEVRDALLENESRDQCAPRDTGSRRRQITGWSRKSRARMCRALAEYDYTPIIAGDRIPAMVTLTYPGDWECVAPSGEVVKNHLRNWYRRFEREWDEVARFIWKLEFQERGAPHIHLWMALPLLPGRSGRNFREWCSAAWASVVNHPDPSQRRKHLHAGTGVDVLKGLQARDPKRLAIYFTKHSSPNMEGAKEYQHNVPEPWREPGKGPGRFWGAVGLKKATAKVEIAEADYLNGRRILRRWSRHKAIYADVGSRFPTQVVPRTAKVSVPRVDPETGRVRFRRVRRRRQLCSQGGLAGGFALANNGPDFASQLARALSAWEGSDCWEYWKITRADDGQLAWLGAMRPNAPSIFDRAKIWTLLPRQRSFVANWFVTADRHIERGEWFYERIDLAQARELVSALPTPSASELERIASYPEGALPLFRIDQFPVHEVMDKRSGVELRRR